MTKLLVVFKYLKVEKLESEVRKLRNSRSRRDARDLGFLPGEKTIESESDRSTRRREAIVEDLMM